MFFKSLIASPNPGGVGLRVLYLLPDASNRQRAWPEWWGSLIGHHRLPSQHLMWMLLMAVRCVGIAVPDHEAASQEEKFKA